MLEIKRPIYSETKNHSVLTTDIFENGIKKTVWFKVDKKFGKYLTWVRGDAFVVALLDYAMRNNHDISSEATLGEDLYYHITHYLIKSLSDNSKILYPTKIDAEIDNKSIRLSNAVGTGISCGIDSLHVLSLHSNSKFSNHNITHLAFNNVGSHGEINNARKLYDERREIAREFAKENHYEYVESDSNIYEVFFQDHLHTHTYSSCFAILCLQKLYKYYFYASSGRKIDKFSLRDNEKYDSSLYEILSLPNFSSQDLTIYSEGSSLSRFEKTKNILNYPPSFKYLNVCLYESNNCGKCSKCKRTLLTFDALNSLDKYKDVFDINEYNKRRYKHLAYFIRECWNKNEFLLPLYPLLHKYVNPFH